MSGREGIGFALSRSRTEKPAPTPDHYPSTTSRHTEKAYEWSTSKEGTAVLPCKPIWTHGAHTRAPSRTRAVPPPELRERVSVRRAPDRVTTRDAGTRRNAVTGR